MQCKLRYHIISIALCLLLNTPAFSQDIPLFTQKLTNSFLYNPAIAGENFGSVTLAHRSSYLGVQDAPQNNFLAFHTPFYNHKFGAGVNVYQEKVNFLSNIFITGAFAYHINFSEYTIFSMGVAAEYTSVKFDINSDFKGDPEDGLLQNTISEPDFSFGLNFQHRYFKIGGAINRLATHFELTKGAEVLNEFYSGYAAGLIPLRGGLDILEPTVSIRKFAGNSRNFDVGLYYTYNDLLLVGASMRRGLGLGYSTDQERNKGVSNPSLINLTTGIKINKKILVGYSYEMVGNELSSTLGSTHEITLRMDFNDRTYQDRFSRDYKSSMNFRRKTLSGTSVRKKVGSKSPRSFSKRKKKQIRQMSPSKRYQNIKKLSKVKRPKFSVKKRQKNNYKKRNKKKNRYRRKR